MCDLRNPTQPKPTPPIRNLSYRHSIDTLINPLNPLCTIYRHKRRHRARHFLALRRGLVLRHLHGLHARAEAHSRICLRQTTGHTAPDAGEEVRGAGCFGVVFGFGGDEEEDGTLWCWLRSRPRG